VLSSHKFELMFFLSVPELNLYTEFSMASLMSLERRSQDEISKVSAPNCSKKRLRWSRGSVLAFGIQFREFEHGRSLRIFWAKKSSARLPSEGK
jgi:hypothetical protein